MGAAHGLRAGAYVAYLAASRQTGENRQQSVEARDALADRMTPDQLAEARRLARELDAAPPREA